MRETLTVVYHLSWFAYLLVVALICDVGLIRHHVLLAFLYAKRSRRLKKIAKLEAILQAKRCVGSKLY